MKLSLQLPAEHASLPQLRTTLRQWLATTTPASAEESHDLILATWEACANAIEHPLAPLRKEIGVELQLLAGAVSVTVRDSGLWLRHDVSPLQSFGARLIETLMDAVEVKRSGDGTSVVMRLVLGEDRNARRSGSPRSGELSTP